MLQSISCRRVQGQLSLCWTTLTTASRIPIKPSSNGRTHSSSLITVGGKSMASLIQRQSAPGRTFTSSSSVANTTAAASETNHSQAVARGKYVHELQVHNVKPEAMEKYKALVAVEYPRISTDPTFNVRLCGSWNTQVGEMDQSIHIWEYKNYPGFTDTVSTLASDPTHQAFLRALVPLLRSRTSDVLQEFAFWHTSPPMHNGGIYELRSYRLKPGKLLDWEGEWKRGIEARRRFVTPVGAWFTQLGSLNYVHHLWSYPDLQTRRLKREEAWRSEGWATTTVKTVPLIEEMRNRILVPMPFSPLN